MSFNIEYFEHKKYILVEMEGLLLLDDFEKILKQIVTSKTYPSNINTIYDLSNMSFSKIDQNILKGLELLVRQYNDLRSGAKAVYVCPDDLQYGMLRAWTVYADEMPVNIMVERTMEKAILMLENEGLQST